MEIQMHIKLKHTKFKMKTESMKIKTNLKY